MANVLIRGLSDEAVTRIDAEANRLGLSRNEYLRRRLDGESATGDNRSMSVADLQRASTATQDLLNDDVMSDAWR